MAIDESLGSQETAGAAGTQPRDMPSRTLGSQATVGPGGRGASVPEDRAGDVIGGRYELLEVIGQGGFAVVWKAVDRKLSRSVAVKRLKRTSGGGEGSRVLERFRREAVSIGRLKHRNIVDVYDHDDDARGHYLVMEYIDGGSLREYLRSRGGKLGADEALRFAKGIAAGLAYAHGHKVIHRDVKPANILLSREGGELVPRLVDFGLARDSSDSGAFSVSGLGMGTPYYMPPEQRRDAKKADFTADIYALGKTLYEMLTGDVPDSIDPDKIPAGVFDVVNRCVKTNPRERYQSADEFTAALGKLRGGASQRKRAANDHLCPKCGAENTLNDEFCGGCGADLTRPCPECAKKISVFKRFCGFCGTDVELFARVLAALGKVKEFFGDRKLAEVAAFEKEEGVTVDEAVALKGEKGRAAVAEYRKVCGEAREAASKRDAANRQAQAALDNALFAQADELLARSLETDPFQPNAVKLREKIVKWTPVHRDYLEARKVFDVRVMKLCVSKLRELGLPANAAGALAVGIAETEKRAEAAMDAFNDRIYLLLAKCDIAGACRLAEGVPQTDGACKAAKDMLPALRDWKRQFPSFDAALAKGDFETAAKLRESFGKAGLPAEGCELLDQRIAAKKAEIEAARAKKEREVKRAGLLAATAAAVDGGRLDEAERLYSELSALCPGDGEVLQLKERLQKAAFEKLEREKREAAEREERERRDAEEKAQRERREAAEREERERREAEEKARQEKLEAAKREREQREAAKRAEMERRMAEAKARREKDLAEREERRREEAGRKARRQEASRATRVRFARFAKKNAKYAALLLLAAGCALGAYRGYHRHLARRAEVALQAEQTYRAEVARLLDEYSSVTNVIAFSERPVEEAERAAKTARGRLSEAWRGAADAGVSETVREESLEKADGVLQSVSSVAQEQAARLEAEQTAREEAKQNFELAVDVLITGLCTKTNLIASAPSPELFTNKVEKLRKDVEERWAAAAGKAVDPSVFDEAMARVDALAGQVNVLIAERRKELDRIAREKAEAKAALEEAARGAKEENGKAFSVVAAEKQKVVEESKIREGYECKPVAEVKPLIITALRERDVAFDHGESDWHMLSPMELDEKYGKYRKAYRSFREKEEIKALEEKHMHVLVEERRQRLESTVMAVRAADEAKNKARDAWYEARDVQNLVGNKVKVAEANLNSANANLSACKDRSGDRLNPLLMAVEDAKLKLVIAKEDLRVAGKNTDAARNAYLEAKKALSNAFLEAEKALSEATKEAAKAFKEARKRRDDAGHVLKKIQAGDMSAKREELVMAEKELGSAQKNLLVARREYRKYFPSMYEMADYSGPIADAKVAEVEKATGLKFVGDRRWLARTFVNGESLLDEFRYYGNDYVSAAKGAAAQAFEAGFSLASFSISTNRISVEVFVDKGRFGPFKVRFVDAEGNLVYYDKNGNAVKFDENGKENAEIVNRGHSFTEKQVLKLLQGRDGTVREGAAFNFIDFVKHYCKFVDNNDIVASVTFSLLFDFDEVSECFFDFANIDDIVGVDLVPLMDGFSYGYNGTNYVDGAVVFDEKLVEDPNCTRRDARAIATEIIVRERP